MKPSPSVMGNAKVILYAVIDSRCRPTGNCKHFISGKRMGPSAGMAICQYEDEKIFWLFGCDEHWGVVTDTCFQSLEEAKGQAEFEYEGISKIWEKPGAI